MSEDRKEVVVRGDGGGLHHEVFVGSHRLSADEPPHLGGSDQGPNPYDLLLASLGACTAMTVTMYAQRKGMPLRGVTTRLRHSRIHADDCAACETEKGKLDSIELSIELDGPLRDEQRSTLLEVSHKCPVPRTPTPEKVITVRSCSEPCQHVST